MADGDIGNQFIGGIDISEFVQATRNATAVLERMSRAADASQKDLAGLSANTVSKINAIKRAADSLTEVYGRVSTSMSKRTEELNKQIDEYQRTIQNLASSPGGPMTTKVIGDFTQKLQDANDEVEQLKQSSKDLAEQQQELVRQLEEQRALEIKEDLQRRRVFMATELAKNALVAFGFELVNINRTLRQAGMGWSQSLRETAASFGASLRSVLTGTFMTAGQEAGMRASFARGQLLTGERSAGLGLREAIGALAQRGGVDVDRASQLTYGMYQYGGYNRERATEQVNMIKKVADSSGAALGAVIQEMSDNMDLLANASNQVPGALARAVIEAKRLGVSIQSIEGVANRLTSDFETYLTAQAELQTVMPGMDLTGVMMAAQYGSTDDMIQALQGALGGQDIANMPRSVRQMISGAIGMSEAELVKMTQGEKRPEELQASQLSEAETTNDLLKGHGEKLTAILGALAGIAIQIGMVSVLRQALGGRPGGALSLRNMRQGASNFLSMLWPGNWFSHGGGGTPAAGAGRGAATGTGNRALAGIPGVTPPTPPAPPAPPAPIPQPSRFSPYRWWTGPRDAFRSSRETWRTGGGWGGFKERSLGRVASARTAATAAWARRPTMGAAWGGIRRAGAGALRGIGGVAGGAALGLGAGMIFGAAGEGLQGMAEQSTGKKKVALGTLGMAAQGAAMGAMLGPWGAAIGAAVGALIGFVQSVGGIGAIMRGISSTLNSVWDGFKEVVSKVTGTFRAAIGVWRDLTQLNFRGAWNRIRGRQSEQADQASQLENRAQERQSQRDRRQTPPTQQARPADDFISPPQPSRSITVGPETRPINERDTVIAGTSLMTFAAGMLGAQQQTRPTAPIDFTRLERKLDEVVRAISSMDIIVEMDNRKVADGVVAAKRRG